MSEQEPKIPKTPSEYEAWLERRKPKVEEFTEIDGSPVPGITLRKVLRGHSDSINVIAWSPTGKRLVSSSGDNSFRFWDTDTGLQLKQIPDTVAVWSVAWSPLEKFVVSRNTEQLQIWNYSEDVSLHSTIVNSCSSVKLAWSPDGRILAYTSNAKNIELWDSDTTKNVRKLKKHTASVYSLAWSKDGKFLASGTHSDESSICIWDTESWNVIQEFKLKDESIFDLLWMPDRELLLAATSKGKIHVFDIRKSSLLLSIEGHTAGIDSITLSADGRCLASKSRDNTIRLWNCNNWETVALLSEALQSYAPVIAFHPSLPLLATLGEKDTVIRIWELDEELLLGQAQESVHYTTAKLVLVGDSGVGKTGLGWRLAHGKYKEHESTHGQQFWTIPELDFKRKDGTECEAVLWDLAGQHVYRQIHSIFLENVAAALVLFDPSNRQDPLKGVQFWLEQLKGREQLPPAVLVGARVDRGAPALSQQELEQFCQRYGIRGGYISTSAKSGEGLETLLQMLKKQIPWEDMTATVTTLTFKRIKDYVLALKEKPNREGVLVPPAELRKQLQETDREWSFTDAEMMTAVGHLETHGYVTVLRNSAGERFILLTPDLLVTLASSIILLADKHPRELGAISETELLQGRYPFSELAGLSPTESQILLDAAILRFLQHNICFRETLKGETLLIFPALIKQKRPLQDDLPSTDDTSYVVRGRVENLYASLVVLLGYTSSFNRINQWQNQAQYEMGEGEICGFRLIEDREGEIELVLYYGDRIPESGRVKFQELFEQFLYQRDVDVTPFPPVVCVNGHQQKRATVIERVREQKPFMFCDECGDKIILPDFDKPQMIGIGVSPWLEREAAAARLRSLYEVQLTKVKGYRRDWAAPRCYLSYLTEQASWAERLINHLRDAGIYVVEQPAQVQPDDFVVVLDTPEYQKAFNTPVLAADAPLIRARLGKRQLISLATTGRVDAHELKDCLPGSFCDESHYSVSLFDLVLNLYVIPFTHIGFAPLRQILHKQWEQTLAQKQEDVVNSPLEIFISYSHEDETLKDELVTMLAGLQRRGIVKTWQDGLIEAGDEWNKSIQDAMNNCDLALLLVSANYLASRFLQEEEQPKLLQRRQEMQLRVIPIILRPCPWQSEPVLKDLRALPKNGKAVITFSKDNGDRDQVWADIAAMIEKRAKA